MRGIVLILSLLCLITGPAAACYNGHDATLLNGTWQSAEDPFYVMPPAPVGRNLQAEAPANRRRLHTLDSLWRTHHRLADYTDYGLTLAYLGRYAEARKVFEQLEAWQPNQYATAANLGTTYELLGENQLALRWIERAIQLNPRSHQGTEWLHANILRAKLRGAAAANSSFLLGIDFGTATVPVDSIVAGSPQPVLLDSVQHALYYQLTERLSFVPPPDSLVGQLLFDLGNTYALTSNVEAAMPVYAQAWRYGYHDKLLIRRYIYFWRLHNGLSTTADIVLLLLGIGLAGGLLWGLWRLSRVLWRLAVSR